MGGVLNIISLLSVRDLKPREASGPELHRWHMDLNPGSLIVEFTCQTQSACHLINNLSVLVSHGCQNKSPSTLWLKTTGNYCLKFQRPEVRNSFTGLISRCRQGCFLLGALGKIHLLLFSSFWRQPVFPSSWSLPGIILLSFSHSHFPAVKSPAASLL